MSTAKSRRGPAASAAGSLKVRRTAGGISVRATGAAAARLTGALATALAHASGTRHVTVRFVDTGQDFLEWDIDATLKVVACRPYQANVWVGTQIMGGIVPGERLQIIPPATRKPTWLKHEVAEVVEGLRA